MKKIMKKALSLILVLALAIVPMTAMAAVGDTEVVQAEKVAELPNNYTASSVVYTPDAFGKLTIDIIEATPDYDIYVNYASIANGTGSGSHDYVVRAGVQYVIEIYGYADASTIKYSVTFTETEAPAVGSEANPKMITGESEQITIPANSTYYCECAPAEDGDYNLSVSGNGEFAIVEELPMWQGGGTQEIPSTNGEYTATFNYYPSYGASPYALTVKNSSAADLTLTVTQERLVGTYSSPAELVMGTNTANNPDGDYYYYEYIAEEDGVLSIDIHTLTATNGWWFDGYVLDTTTWVQTYFGDSAFRSDADPVVSYVEVPVKAGQEVSLMVSALPVPNAYGWEDVVAGTVDFTAAFKNYTISDQTLDLGENAVTISQDYEWTLFEFTPDEAGVYKFQTDDGAVGYWGAGTYYVVEPTDDVTTVLEYTLYNAGPSIVVGIPQITDTGCNITVTRIGDAVQQDEVQWTVYDNKKTPETFEYAGDATKLEGVDVEDPVVDKAVLGTDGYYHLNSADGPILYVNLNEEMMSLVSMVGYGKVGAVYYDADGKVTEKIDYTEALLEYIACADSIDAETTLYPLTEDLMTIYQNVGDANGWYGENGWLELTGEDAWMFACYYVEGTTTGGNTTGGNTTGGTTTGGTTTGGATSGSTTSTPSPTTGDNSNIAVWAIAMVVAAGAAFVVAESKKRAR